jgi:hypothetical protein
VPVPAQKPPQLLAVGIGWPQGIVFAATQVAGEQLQLSMPVRPEQLFPQLSTTVLPHWVLSAANSQPVGTQEATQPPLPFETWPAVHAGGGACGE